MGIRVGIDLGTTFSAVARIDPATGKPVIIRNSFGLSTTPSVLCFQRDGSVLFGDDAKNMQAVGDTNAVAFFKRSMGNPDFAVEILGKTYSATDLSAILLQKLKEEAEQECGESIDAAVITVPAYFREPERAATLEAAQKAGLNVINIINEPTAAALAYGLNEKTEPQTVLIYDLGGGTFDVTLAQIDRDEIRILGSDGDHELGGKDWDDCIARYLAGEFQEKYGVDISQDPEMVASLLVTAENVKRQLTHRDAVKVPICFQGIQGRIDITEQIFEDISSFLIGITREVIDRLMDSVEIGWSQVDGVILVGGSTRMRMIHNYVQEMSGKPPLYGVHTDEAVALGAAIRANITETGEAVSLSGRKSRGGEMVAIQGAKAVTDVTAHSMGMIAESEDGEAYINSTIIKKNKSIPAADTRSYKLRTHSGDNELEVYVLQGDHRRPLDNTIIHKYVISGIKRTNSPSAIIDVTYAYTVNGVVEVSAVQQETGKKLSIRVEPVPEDMSWTDLSPRENRSGSGGRMPSVDVLLAVDLSGSMYMNNGEPIREAKAAMDTFVDQMDRSCVRIGVLAFADQTELVQALSDNYKAVHRAISRLESVKVGFGNRTHPFNQALSLLQGGLLKKQGEVRYVVVLTDGCWSNSSAAINAAKKCHRDGIEVMALGFGTANESFLREIASTDEFASLTDLSGLSSSFSKIAQAIGDGSTGLRVKE